MTTTTDTTGRTINLDGATTTTDTTGHLYATETVHILHGVTAVYIPAPTGGVYCHTAQCTHNHPDTPRGAAQATACSTRLARIITRDNRIPTWANLI